MSSNWLYFPQREVLIPGGFSFFCEIWTINYKTRQPSTPPSTLTCVDRSHPAKSQIVRSKLNTLTFLDLPFISLLPPIAKSRVA